jgi:hypothetical protein
VVVHSKRGVLILQAAVLAAGAWLAGWAVETWDLLPMTRLSDRAGLPVALLFFGIMGTVVAFVVVKDYWGHRIAFEADGLRIDDSLGTTRVPYDEVAEVKPIPMYGAGIRLKPGNRWLATFEGRPSDRRKKEKLSAIALGAYGCEITLPGRSMDIGVDRFVEALRRRLGDQREGGGDAMGDGSRAAILRAAMDGDVEALRRAVAEDGADAVRLDDDPMELTALHLAAAGGHGEAVDYLLSPPVGADPRAARNNNFTPLHSAAMFGHAAVCEALLRAGAGVDVQTDPQGYAPLHSAAFAGHLEAIRVLLAHGADRTLTNYRGERPADTARRQGQEEAAEMLEADLT